MRPIAVSGGFDPLHDGHIELLRFAASLGDGGRCVTVVVESDKWVEKKHPVLLPRRQRLTVIRRLCYVHEAHANPNDEGDCSSLLRYLNAGAFVVGPDHADGKFPEAETCRAIGTKVVVRPPMPQIDGVHSSALLAAVAKPRWENPIPMVAVVLECATVHDGVLLGRRPGTGALELPGGFAEVGETLEDAARREVREELGREMQFCRYFHSVHGRYSDGRKIVVAGFRGLINQPPLRTPEWGETVYAQAMPPPDTVWDNAADRDILGNHFAWRRQR